MQTPPAVTNAPNRFLRTRRRLSWGLAAVLALLVLAFNLVSVFLPEAAGRPAWPGTIISLGAVFGLGVMAAAIAAAVCYVHRLNVAESRLQRDKEEREW